MAASQACPGSGQGKMNASTAHAHLSNENDVTGRLRPRVPERNDPPAARRPIRIEFSDQELTPTPRPRRTRTRPHPHTWDSVASSAKGTHTAGRIAVGHLPSGESMRSQAPALSRGHTSSHPLGRCTERSQKKRSAGRQVLPTTAAAAAGRRDCYLARFCVCALCRGATMYGQTEMRAARWRRQSGGLPCLPWRSVPIGRRWLRLRCDTTREQNAA